MDSWRRKNLRRPSDATSSLLFLNLMVADLIQGLGESLRLAFTTMRAVNVNHLALAGVTPNIKWMADGVRSYIISINTM